MDKHADWYKTNDYFRYEEGDTLKLRNKCSAGYGLDPIATVIDCVTEKNVFDEDENFYLLEVDRYDYDYHEKQNDVVTFYEWMRGKRLPKGHRRVVSRERHFKWNVEYHFKKVR
jgi:hypothetical protein